MRLVELLILIGVFMLLPLVNLSGKKRYSLLVEKLMEINAEHWFTNKNEIEFCKAIEWENTNKMRKLLYSGLNINTQGKYGITFLVYSYFKEKKKSYRWLLENGADPNILMQCGRFEMGNIIVRTGFCETALSFAAYDRDTYYLELALKYGGNPNATIPGGITGKPIHIIHWAIGSYNFTNVQLLIEAGANPDGIGDGSPLESVIGGRRYDIAYYLLEKGANPDLKRDSIIDSMMNFKVYIDIQIEYKEKVKKLLEEKWKFDFSEENLKRIEKEKEERRRKWEEELKKKKEEKSNR